MNTSPYKFLFSERNYLNFLNLMKNSLLGSLIQEFWKPWVPEIMLTMPLCPSLPPRSNPHPLLALDLGAGWLNECYGASELNSPLGRRIWPWSHTGGTSPLLPTELRIWPCPLPGFGFLFGGVCCLSFHEPPVLFSPLNWNCSSSSMYPGGCFS